MNKEELDEMNRRTRKTMFINCTFHGKSDIGRLYIARKNCGLGESAVKSV